MIYIYIYTSVYDIRRIDGNSVKKIVNKIGIKIEKIYRSNYIRDFFSSGEFDAIKLVFAVVMNDRIAERTNERKFLFG